jgi:cobalt-precorrin-5B (C1)-methyltransferase
MLMPGAGVGRKGADGDLCVSAYARDLLERNLLPLDRGLTVEVVLPRGRELALRTSNAAFGVVDGLALIGTQAEVQRSAAPDELKQVLLDLTQLTGEQEFQGDLVLVIGENGLDLARQAQLAPLLKVGNWLGPVLVAAAEAGVQNLLLLGYHGKLIKLAGGIFHTHHHLADGRLEVLTALGLDAGLSLEQLRLLRQAPSVDQAFNELEALNPVVAEQLWQKLALAVEERSQAYVARYGNWSMRIGAVLFDRSRHLRWRGPVAGEHFFTLMD